MKSMSQGEGVGKVTQNKGGAGIKVTSLFHMISEQYSKQCDLEKVGLVICKLNGFTVILNS